MNIEILEERIQDILEKMKDLDPCSDEYRKATSNLEILMKYRDEAERIELDRTTMYEENHLGLRKVHVDRTRNWIELTKGLGVPLLGLVAMRMITKLEEEGTVRSKGLGLGTSFFKFK